MTDIATDTVTEPTADIITAASEVPEINGEPTLGAAPPIEDTPTSDLEPDPQPEPDGPVDSAVADSLGLPPQKDFKTKQAYIKALETAMVRQKEELAARAADQTPDKSKNGPADTATLPETDTPAPQDVPPPRPLMSSEDLKEARTLWVDERDEEALDKILDDARNLQDATYQHFDTKHANMLKEIERLGTLVTELQTGQTTLSRPSVVQAAIAATEGAIDADATRALQLMQEKGIEPELAVEFALMQRRIDEAAQSAQQASPPDPARRARSQAAADASTPLRRPPPPSAGGLASEDTTAIFGKMIVEANQR